MKPAQRTCVPKTLPPVVSFILLNIFKNRLLIPFRKKKQGLVTLYFLENGKAALNVLECLLILSLTNVYKAKDLLFV